MGVDHRRRHIAVTEQRLQRADERIEAASAVKFYFATPHHGWERGANENTNGLIRQYLPKGQTMKGVTQTLCDLIAEQLNNRPRKRHGYKTPNQCFLRH